jgi:small subunit ribosomal protein S2
MPNLPDLLAMLQAGMHFGHLTSKRHPKMQPYIFGQRSNINIIDLEKTAERLKIALDFVIDKIASGGTILFASTKLQASPLIEKYAKECGMPYIANRWIGGTLTNFGSIIRLPKKLKDLEGKFERGEMKKYTKKEQLSFQNEIEKLKEVVEGMKTLEKLPDILFICDLKKDRTALAEANKKHIPVVAISDTNTNPAGVDYIIPANDDAVKSLEMVIKLMAEAVSEGLAKRQTTNQLD